MAKQLTTAMIMEMMLPATLRHSLLSILTSTLDPILTRSMPMAMGPKVPRPARLTISGGIVWVRKRIRKVIIMTNKDEIRAFVRIEITSPKAKTARTIKSEVHISISHSPYFQ